MTSPTNPLPKRMRSYRVEAELRETPDLHQPAQLFIGMALALAEKDHAPCSASAIGRRTAAHGGLVHPDADSGHHP